MIEWGGLALSAALAHVATNLDNLAILVGLSLTVGQMRTVVGFLIVQLVVLAAAYFVAAGLEAELPAQVGYLGLIPMALGIFALIKRRKEDDQSALVGSDMQLFAVIALFMSVSFDTFAVLTPLLADSRAGLTAPILIGAGASAIGLAVLGARLAKMAPSRVARLERLEWLAPYVMIVIGFYVLVNTGTDIA